MTYLLEEPSEGRKYLVRADTSDDAVQLFIEYTGGDLAEFLAYGQFVITNLSELLTEDRPVRGL